MTKDMMLTELHELIAEGSLTTFLYDDVWAFLDSLHYYKLRHVYDNRDYFLEYVQGLDNQYTSFGDGASDTMEEGEMNTLSMQQAQAKSAIEGMFILSCMEFTCACPERMLVIQAERKVHVEK